MAGMCVVEGLRALDVERVALNAVYYWPDWHDGIAHFLRKAGFDLVYVGNLVGQGFYETQAPRRCTTPVDGTINRQLRELPGARISQ